MVMRSSTLQIDQWIMVAAQAVGCSISRVLMTEVMPNVVNNLIVITTIEIAHAIILEAALSFLGGCGAIAILGVDGFGGKDMMLLNLADHHSGCCSVFAGFGY